MEHGTIEHEGRQDIKLIDEDDMEEMDIKWNMALLSMRADKFWKRTGKKISIQGSDVAGFDKSKERVRKESYGQRFKAEEKSSKALMAIDGVGWDWSYMANEEDHALVADGETPTEFALMANNENKVFDNSLCSKECRKNTKSLNNKIDELKNDIDELKNDLYEANVYRRSYKLRIDQLEDRLAEYKEREVKYIESIRSLERDKESSTSAEDQNNDTSTSEETASTNPSKPFIKFVKPKDSQPESKIEEQETHKKPQLGLEFVLHKKPCFNCGDFSHLAKDCRRRVQRETNRSQNHSYKSSTHRSAGHRPNGAHMRPPLRSSGPRPQGNSMRPPFRPAGHKSHGPSMNPRRPTMNGTRPYKTFFQTPSFETRPFLKSSAVNNSYRAPWVSTANRKRVKKGTSRNQDNTHKSFPPRPIAHSSYRPPVRPVRTNMNGVHTNRTTFNKQAHLYANRPFQRTSAVRSQNRAAWVPTVNRNFPPVDRKFSSGSRNFPTTNRKFPTASTKFPTSSMKFSTVDMGIKGKAIKPLACWFWKPLQNLSNKGPNNNSVSVMFKKYTYIDTQGRLKHMTSNISYLSDYEPFDRGYVSFGQGGCKITGKGTIKTGKLEFENIYFVKDLKEFSNARTPQQNGVAERRNRTLIKAAKTMLADAKLPVTFWAEAVNTACYV
nr:putative ribonuclease H-like domain-containing protein [Tanacetum cinerariifolium]